MLYYIHKLWVKKIVNLPFKRSLAKNAGTLIMFDTYILAKLQIALIHVVLVSLEHMLKVRLHGK